MSKNEYYDVRIITKSNSIFSNSGVI